MRAAHREVLRAEVWLLIEWPNGEAQPTKYFLCTLPEEVSFEQLVDTVKMRSRIERDYLELKQELGSATTRDATGAASIIMRACVSPLTAF